MEATNQLPFKSAFKISLKISIFVQQSYSVHSKWLSHTQLTSFKMFWRFWTAWSTIWQLVSSPTTLCSSTTSSARPSTEQPMQDYELEPRVLHKITGLAHVVIQEVLVSERNRPFYTSGHATEKSSETMDLWVPTGRPPIAHDMPIIIIFITLLGAVQTAYHFWPTIWMTRVF